MGTWRSAGEQGVPADGRGNVSAGSVAALAAPSGWVGEARRR